MDDFRIQRMENLIQEKIGILILSGQIKDPRVNSMLSVTRVQVAKDMSFAKVFISSFQDEKRGIKGVEGLNSASGFIQNHLGKQLKTRNTPKLLFVYDSSIKEGFEINRKIDGLVSE